VDAEYVSITVEPADLEDALRGARARGFRGLHVTVAHKVAVVPLVDELTPAARLGLSISGMKSRVQRGRRQLKRVLVDCCEVELDRRRSVMGYRPRRASCDCGPEAGQ
jgi:hypothetical protein